MAVKHLGLKCLSVGVAALLWFLISGQQIAERALRIPLEYSNLPTGLEMTGDTPMVVDVRVRGSAPAVSRMAAGELVAVLDVGSAKPGHRLFHLTTADVRTPFGIEVVTVTPSSVALNVEPSAAKMVPVVPAIEGDPAPGFQVGAVSADPATVEVVGPVSAVKSLTTAITEPVSVEGATAPVRESVTVGVPNPAVRLRRPQNAVVVVDITGAPLEPVR